MCGFQKASFCADPVSLNLRRSLPHTEKNQVSTYTKCSIVCEKLKTLRITDIGRYLVCLFFIVASDSKQHIRTHVLRVGMLVIAKSAAHVRNKLIARKKLIDPQCVSYPLKNDEFFCFINTYL